MRFTKMHGAGNDYVYVDLFDEEVSDAPALARLVSDRNKGIGGDGLILLAPSRTGDVRMEMYNADGSRAQMCGNGVRCLAHLARDHGRVESAIVRAATVLHVIPVVHGRLLDDLRDLDSDETVAKVIKRGKAMVPVVDEGTPIAVSTHEQCHGRKRSVEPGAVSTGEAGEEPNGETP